LTRIFVVSWDRPPEQEGLPTTAYFEDAANAYWLHQGGGLSEETTWFGPFNLRDR